MPREQEPATAQREFVLEALKQRIRVDGRELLEGRKPELIFGDELGWVECRLGKTRVIAQVSGTIGRPRPERPYEGLLTIVSEISPMASSVYESGRSSEEEVIITRMLEKVLRRSDALDREALCILAGQRVWHIKLTIHFLSDEGNMLDCACLAGIAALRHYRKPDVEVIGDDVTIHDPTERAPVPLAIHHSPICISLAFFEDSAHPILDPTHLETLLSSSLFSLSLTNVTSPAPSLCVLHKAGGIPLTVQEISYCVQVAVTRAKELGIWLQGKLDADWGLRKELVEVR